MAYKMGVFISFILLFVVGCSGIKSSLKTSEKDFNQTARYEGPQARISVVVFCKTERCNKNLAGAVKDLLINELVVSNRFIILERGENLESIKKELLLSNSGLVDIKKAVPAGLLEGADILVVGSITAVEPDKTKFFVPVIIPWREGGRQHITGGLFELKKTYIQIFARIIDVRTGRILKSFRAEGEYTKWDTAIGEGAFKEGALLGGVQIGSNISVDMAVMDLVKKLSKEIIKGIPDNYYRYR